MTTRTRWVVKAGIFASAGLLAVVFGVTAVRATAQVVATTDPSTRQALLLAAVGAWLKGFGIVGLYVTQAVGFRDWSTFALPFAPVSGRLGGRRGLRRARRQIDGVEPYAPDEVPRLRSVAEFRVSLVRAGSGATNRLASLSLLPFLAGFLLQPPVLPSSSGTGSVLGHVLQVLAVVMIVVLLASFGFCRPRVDAKAAAFLDQTSGAHRAPEVPPR